MKTAYIGTYPPRRCGIGTFTENLFKSAEQAFGNKVDGTQSFVVAINDNGTTYDYPSEVKYTIEQEVLDDYLKAADYINNSGANICILEHEYGIFGGDSGIFILSLLHKLKIPIVVTLHTVLKTPSYNQKAVLQQICRMALKVVVMSHKAIEFLINIYDVPMEKISFIPHGVPDIKHDRQKVRKEFGFEDKKVLLTFGFVSRNKGHAVAIKALPRVVEKHPNLLYIILGRTHPAVLRHAGEEYRESLVKLVHEHKLEKHVQFIDEFATDNDLFKYLYAADIYLTPYLNEAQITSGTLAYALGIGSAVVSTPYWHAAELLNEGRGRLFKFGDHDALADILLRLLDDPAELKEIKSKAYEYGREMTWPKTGRQYAELAIAVIKSNHSDRFKNSMLPDLTALPSFSLKHADRLTDSTGIIQHAKYGIADFKEGYCLDDNARALLMSAMAYRLRKDSRALELMPTYLSYLHYMQSEDGYFRNFLSFSRQYLDERGSEDSFGRTIWALGYLIRFAPNDAYKQVGCQMYFNAVHHTASLGSIRAIATSIVGIYHYLKAQPADEVMTERLKELTGKLVHHYYESSSDNWQWFESLLAYDNALLPYSLLCATELLKSDPIKEVAIESMSFLEKHTFNNGHLSVIGNEKWFKKEGERSFFAQQPIDAMAMVLMYHQAYRMTGKDKYLKRLYKSFLWFLGENDLRISLYDHDTHGCCDGFEYSGVNRNQGAESTLAFLISYLTVLDVEKDITALISRIKAKLLSTSRRIIA
ncbi:MAG TPA: glycosyltransferase [Bacteroidales bacterium]|nr:glycosyltransferase [Bacteroidales bacterium]